MKKIVTNVFFFSHQKVSERKNWLQRHKWPNGIIKIIIKLNQVIPNLHHSIIPSRIILAFEGGGWGNHFSGSFSAREASGLSEPEQRPRTNGAKAERADVTASLVSTTSPCVAVRSRKLTLCSSSSISSSV